MKALSLIFIVSFFFTQSYSYKIFAKKYLDKKITLAQKYFEQKKCSKMIKTLNGHTSNLSSMWLKKMAYCLKKTNNLKQEQNIYLQLLEKNPKDYFSHFTLGRLYQKENTQEKKNTTLTNNTVKHFRKAIEIKATFIPAYIKLFNIFKNQKNYYELQTLSESLLKIKKTNKIALTHLCFSYFQQDYIEETIKWCKKAIKQTKTNLADSFVYLALSMNKHKKSSGNKTLLYASKKFPKSTLVASSLANKYYKEKKYNLSAGYYKKILKLKNKDFNTLQQAVWSFFEIKKYNLSLEALKQLCLINKQEGVHIVRTAISKLEKEKKKKWLSPYRLSLAKDCH